MRSVYHIDFYVIWRTWWWQWRNHLLCMHSVWQSANSQLAEFRHNLVDKSMTVTWNICQPKIPAMYLSGNFYYWAADTHILKLVLPHVWCDESCCEWFSSVSLCVVTVVHRSQECSVLLCVDMRGYLCVSVCLQFCHLNVIILPPISIDCMSVLSWNMLLTYMFASILCCLVIVMLLSRYWTDCFCESLNEALLGS